MIAHPGYLSAGTVTLTADYGYGDTTGVVYLDGGVLASSTTTVVITHETVEEPTESAHTPRLPGCILSDTDPREEARGSDRPTQTDYGGA